MKLLTKKVQNLFSRIPWRSTDGKPYDQIRVVVKFFHPVGRFTYYATEYDGEDTFFGYCISPLGPDCDEWGYMSLSELQSIRVRGLGIERDLHWDDKTTIDKILDGIIS